MILWLVIILSLILHVIVCLFALQVKNYADYSNKHKGWWFFIAGNCILTLRRVYSLYLFTFAIDKLDMVNEILGLFVSCLFVAGYLSSKSLFKHLKSREFEIVNDKEIINPLVVKSKYNDLLVEYNKLKNEGK